jgi:ATP-dependent DNA ligase
MPSRFPKKDIPIFDIEEKSISIKEIEEAGYHRIMDFTLPVLYRRRETGALGQWDIGVEDTGEKVNIVTTYGQVDGKLQTVRREVKKLGRQKTLYEQAVFQAKKKWQDHVKKEGYTETKSSASKGRPFVTPMLASKMVIAGEQPKKKRKTSKSSGPVKNMPFPFFVQPKIDGFRCMATMVDGKLQLVSRKNLPFPGFSSLRKTLLPFFKLVPNSGFGSGTFYLDGELFQEGVPFEILSGNIKRGQNHPDHDLPDIQFRIFDCFDLDFINESFGGRISFLQRLFMKGNKQNRVKIMPKDLQSMVEAYQHKHLRLVPTFEVTSVDEVKEFFGMFMEAGYEGLMGRKGDSPYQPSKRSQYLQKYKEFQDAEFKIVGFQEGAGRDRGTVVWECETKTGEKFSVRPQGTLEQRAEWFQNGNDYIGEQLTVTYQELSEIGVPRFPVGKCIRVVD